MENEPFEDVFPIEYGDFPMSFVSFQGCNFQENSFLHLRKCVSIASLPKGNHTVDGRNPAPVGMYKTM